MPSTTLSQRTNTWAVSKSSLSLATIQTVLLFSYLTIVALIFAIAVYKEIMVERRRFPPSNPNDTEEGREARRRIWDRIEKRDSSLLSDYQSLAIQVESCARDVDKDDVYYIDLVEQARALDYTIKSIRNENRIRYESRRTGIYKLK
ncbi:hypothetical protein H4I96_09366 [Botrytis cinerea]|uniref:Uncharacterized protein n=1 Tax=Botryotinia fuckeliana (strain T4) TaxID=999810 RepID=G2Y3G7_BOTF4|nr:hypothetical protein BofuT4_P003660.1 [Botrytis cinerea T4]